MRPALEVCGNCHWAGKGFGRSSSASSASTPTTRRTTETTTILQMHLGGPGQPTIEGRAIHWHADPRISIELRRDRRGAADDSLRQGDRRGGQGPGVSSTEGTTPAQLAQGEHAHDGLHRLPQRLWAIGFRRRRSTRSTRRSRPADQSQPAVCPAGRRTAAESGLCRAGRGRRAIDEGLRKFYAPTRRRDRRRQPSPGGRLAADVYPQ